MREKGPTARRILSKLALNSNTNLNLWHPLTMLQKAHSFFKNTARHKWHLKKMEPCKNGTQLNCHRTLFSQIYWFEISNQVPDSKSK